MSAAREWVEMLLQNSKAVGSLLLILISGLGFSTWTVFDQQQEITQLKHPIEVQIVEVPVDLKQLKADVKKLKRWHE